MTDQASFPSKTEVQEAMRDVGAAIRLHAEGHIDDATLLLHQSDPTAATTFLVGLVVDLIRTTGGDPAEYGETIALAHSQRLTTLEDEQE